MSEKTIVPALAMLASMLISIVLSSLAPDRLQGRADMGMAGNAVDAALSERVEATLRSDPGLFGSRLTVASQGGIVDLGGSVPDGKTRERALELVGNIRGVREVQSKLVVERLR